MGERWERGIGRERKGTGGAAPLLMQIPGSAPASVSA